MTTARHGPLLATSRRRWAGLAVAGVSVAVAVVASLVVGSRQLPVETALRVLAHPDGSDASMIVNELRVPRTALGVAVGAALGASGCLLQSLTRNPLAEPGLLGVNAGAALAVVATIHLLGVSDLRVFAFTAVLGAAVAAAAAYGLAGARSGGPAPARLALAGAVFAALFTAVTSAILVTDVRTLDTFRFWTVGALSGRDVAVTTSFAPLLLAVTVLSLLAGRALNALSLGDEIARSLGQRVALTRFAVTCIAVVLAGLSVAAAGPISFLGLVAPHAARLLLGPDDRWVLPYSALLGALLLVGADVVGRVVARPSELQVGVVTAVIGAPVLLAIVRSGRLRSLQPETSAP